MHQIAVNQAILISADLTAHLDVAVGHVIGFGVGFRGEIRAAGEVSVVILGGLRRE